MKKSQVLLSLTLLSIIFVTSHAALPAELYWDSVLPNIPIPQAIKKHIISGSAEDLMMIKKEKLGGGGLVSLCFNYAIIPVCSMKSAYGKLDNLDKIFFLEEDMNLGSKKSFEFIRTSNPANFLPRRVAESLPFSSKNMSQVLDELSIQPASDEAKEIRQTIDVCEAPAVEAGEEKSCATSLEAMIDFSTSKLGRNVQVLTSETDDHDHQAAAAAAQMYSIVGLKKMASEKSVVCHKQAYPYAVFNCHLIFNFRGYRVSLVGADGARIKAIAICHEDTSAWNPDHMAFYVLGVKPGAAPVCHFVPGDHIVWIPK